MHDKYSNNLKAKDLIYELSKNPEAQIKICGDEYVYIHCEKDGSVVTLYNKDSLEDLKEDIDKYSQCKEIITQERALDMLKCITENLVMNGDNVKDAYIQLGFTYSEISQLYNW